MSDTIRTVLALRDDSPVGNILTKIDKVWDYEEKLSAFNNKSYTTQNIVVKDDDGSSIKLSLTSQPEISVSYEGHEILLLNGKDRRSGKSAGLKTGQYTSRRGDIVKTLKVNGMARVIIDPDSDVIDKHIEWSDMSKPQEDNYPADPPLEDYPATPFIGDYEPAPASAEVERIMGPLPPNTKISPKEQAAIDIVDCCLFVERQVKSFQENHGQLKDFGPEQIQKLGTSAFISL